MAGTGFICDKSWLHGILSQNMQVADLPFAGPDYSVLQ